MDIIGDAWGFSGKAPITLSGGFSSKAPITPSRGFSVETLTEVTLLWKTESNRSISAIEDGIPR